jgi:3-dehydroquinate dehydratase-2
MKKAKNEVGTGTARAQPQSAGTREPGITARTRWLRSNRRLATQAKAAGIRLESFPDQPRGRDGGPGAAGEEREGVGFILLNPAGVQLIPASRLRDALTAVQIPFVEVHLSNIHAREPWRAHSHFTAVAVGSVLGLGSRGYDLALDYAIARLKSRS